MQKFKHTSDQKLISKIYLKILFSLSSLLKANIDCDSSPTRWQEDAITENTLD